MPRASNFRFLVLTNASRYIRVGNRPGTAAGMHRGQVSKRKQAHYIFTHTPKKALRPLGKLRFNSGDFKFGLRFESSQRRIVCLGTNGRPFKRASLPGANVVTLSSDAIQCFLYLRGFSYKLV